MADKAARFAEMKRRGEPIAMLTAYDAPMARAEAAARVDILLVGDSVGTNMLGYASEQEVTLADMAHHTRAVRRGAPDAFVISDLPVATYETPTEAVANARVLAEAGADMVKFEGCRPAIVEALVGAGFAVCGHLGLEPQHHAEKRLKGKQAGEAHQLVEAALTMEKAGIAMLVLELIPEEVAEIVTQRLKVPTIGIGAGRATDGQVLVICDVLGYTKAAFRHNKRYAEVGETMEAAARAYVGDVHSKAFPAAANAFPMNKEQLPEFLASLA
ncbi:3-methyl-2-oxobutanoate hydroxymethyltransferase [Beijerinckia indica]|nr:3-methyl-2-oxobutanoate hydroxymethyltransferase [Beijerinckia indica]